MLKAPFQTTPALRTFTDKRLPSGRAVQIWLITPENTFLCGLGWTDRLGLAISQYVGDSKDVYYSLLEPTHETPRLIWVHVADKSFYLTDPADVWAVVAAHHKPGKPAFQQTHILRDVRDVVSDIEYKELF